MATPIPRAGGIQPGLTSATASRAAQVTVPGFRAGPASQAATSAIAAPMALEREAEAKTGKAVDKEMAIAFRQLLSMGLEGAQAYVEDIKKMEGLGEVASAAEKQLASIAPVWADPKMGGDVHERTLTNFYGSVDKMIKRATDPSYEEKAKIMADEQIRVSKETAKHQKDIFWKTKRADAQARLDQLRKNLATFEEGAPTFESHPVIQKIVEKKTTELEQAKERLQELENLPPEKLTTGSFIKKLIVAPWLKAIFQKSPEKQKAELRDVVIPKLEAIIADPEANILMLQEGLTQEEKTSITKWREDFPEKTKQYQKDLALLKKQEFEAASLAGAQPSGVSTTTPTTGAAGVKPVGEIKGDRATNAGKIKILQNKLSTATDPATKQRIQNAIQILQQFGV